MAPMMDVVWSLLLASLAGAIAYVLFAWIVSLMAL